MIVAAAYVRVSTDEQTDYSPAAQLADIKEYATHNGYISSYINLTVSPEIKRIPFCIKPC